jgi:hypothetical protein
LPVYKVMADIGGSGISGGSSSGTTYDGTGVNITATSANVTTLTAANAVFTASNTTGTGTANILNVANLTVSGAANFAGATLTGITTDNSTSSHYLYKDAGGNVINATLGNGLSDSSGTLLTVADVAGFSWDGGATAISANTMRCRVNRIPCTLTGWTLDAANASNTIIGFYIGTPNADGTHVSADGTGGANIATGGANASYIANRDLSGWGTNVTVGANVEFCANLISTTATWATLTIHGTR